MTPHESERRSQSSTRSWHGNQVSEQSGFVLFSVCSVSCDDYWAEVVHVVTGGSESCALWCMMVLC